MNVRFHFYSTSKEIAGVSELLLNVPDRSTLGEALETLFHRMAALRSLGSSCLFAIGTSYAPKDAKLIEGDEISIIPPMQGG